MLRDSSSMHRSRSLQEITDLLVSRVYTDLSDKDIEVVWGGTRAFADIVWIMHSPRVRIRVNRQTSKWPEPAAIGLLAHELSHPGQKQAGATEGSTDNDVIGRGLGVYLAVERLVASQYEDMSFNRGRDTYLGYRTVRSRLTGQERSDLDMLLQKLNLAPRRGLPRTILTHDVAFRAGEDSSVLTIGGHRIEAKIASSQPDIKIVVRNQQVRVYADETLVAELDVEDFKN